MVTKTPKSDWLQASGDVCLSHSTCPSGSARGSDPGHPEPGPQADGTATISNPAQRHHSRAERPAAADPGWRPGVTCPGSEAATSHVALPRARGQRAGRTCQPRALGRGGSRRHQRGGRRPEFPSVVEPLGCVHSCSTPRGWRKPHFGVWSQQAVRCSDCRWQPPVTRTRPTHRGGTGGARSGQSQELSTASWSSRVEGGLTAAA